MQTKVVELDLNDVLPNRFQPRIKFSEESIQALSDSIKEHGVIQPIVVRNIGDKYEIIAGERRYKASLLAGKQTIPAIITDLNEKDSAEVAIIENVQRKDLTPIEEAISYKKILDMGYLTQDSLAFKLGKTQSTIANKLRLLNLDDDVQEALLNEKISERHARSLLKLDTHEKQRNLLKRIIEERLTVRKTDEEIDKMINNNENIEMFNFGVPSEPTTSNNNQINFGEQMTQNFEIGNQNIPTTPIIDNSIPEILPAIEPKPTTSFFNPTPEVVNSSVPPVSIDRFTEESLIASKPIFTGGSPTENVNSVSAPVVNEFKPVEANMKDIFTERPLANMDNLLQSSAPIVEPSMVAPITKEPEEKPEDILVPGKFFNLLPEEEEGVKETNSTLPNFNFAFDVNSLNNVESTNNIQTNGNLNNESMTESLFAFAPVEPNNAEIVSPIVEPSNVFESTSKVETPIINQVPINEPMIPELDASSIQPVQNSIENNNLDNSFINLSSEQPAETLFGAPQTNNLEVNIPSFENTNSVFEPTNQLEIPIVNQTSIPEPIMPELSTPLVQSTQSIIENNGLENNFTNLVNFEQPVESSKPELKVAINMVREFIDNLSKLGYIVDLDEFDFENMYQFVLKVNK